MEITTSIVVSFGSTGAAASPLIVFELDPDANGDKTQFSPEDDCFLRLHHDTTVQLDKILATHGQLQGQGTASRPLEQQLLWDELDTSHDLTCIPNGGVSVKKYYGNTALGVRKTALRKIEAIGPILPCLTLVSYSADFSLFRLITPKVVLAADENYPLVVVAYMVPNLIG